MIERKGRYQPDLGQLLELCERNYALLLPLLPEPVQKGLQRGITIGAQSYLLQVTQCSPYTTQLQLSLGFNGEPSLATCLQIRLYHDAGLAEVCASQQIRRFEARYDYPNRQMLQQDEKLQVNRWLADWLRLCRVKGQLGEAVRGEASS